MKKTLMTAMLMLFVLVVSAIGATAPVDYKDWSCWQEKKCVTHPFWFCHWETVCGDKDRETSVLVPEYDDTEIQQRIMAEERKPDKSGMSGMDLWYHLTGVRSNLYSEISFMDYLQPKFDKIQSCEDRVLALEEKVIALQMRLYKLEKGLK
jgi:hypothetical protein